MALAGTSTIGIKFGYAVETTAGTKPTKFKWLTRCNNIAGISIEQEAIDASALEDYITRYIAGRGDTGGTWTVTFNLTNDTISELTAMIGAYKTALAANQQTWFEVWSPYLEKAFFVIAEPPTMLPMPEESQNELNTIELNFVINEYKGLDTAIEPTAA